MMWVFLVTLKIYWMCFSLLCWNLLIMKFFATNSWTQKRIFQQKIRTSHMGWITKNISWDSIQLISVSHLSSSVSEAILRSLRLSGWPKGFLFDGREELQLSGRNVWWMFQEKTYLHLSTRSRWWQLKYVLFSPRKLGKMNPFWRSYFSDGLKPPTRGGQDSNSTNLTQPTIDWVPHWFTIMDDKGKYSTWSSHQLITRQNDFFRELPSLKQFAPENGWLELEYLEWPSLISGANC